MQKVLKKPAAASNKNKAAGSDLSSTRGSEERHATPITGRGQKRGRDYEIEKVRELSSTQGSHDGHEQTHGPNGSSSEHREDKDNGRQDPKRRRMEPPGATRPTNAKSIASQFYIKVDRMKPPSRKDWARCIRNHADSASQSFDWSSLHSTVPYESLDQAEEDADFPPHGYQLPYPPCKDEGDENKKLKLPLFPRRYQSTPPTELKSAPEPDESGRPRSLSPPGEAVMERAKQQFRKEFPPKSSTASPPMAQTTENKGSSTTAQDAQHKPTARTKRPARGQKPTRPPPPMRKPPYKSANNCPLGGAVPPPIRAKKTKSAAKPPARLTTAGISLEFPPEDLLERVFEKRRRQVEKAQLRRPRN